MERNLFRFCDFAENFFWPKFWEVLRFRLKELTDNKDAKMGDDSEKKKIDEEVPMIDVKDGKGAQLEG